VVYEPGTQVFVEDYAAKKNGQVVYDALHPCKSEVVFVKEFGKVESTEVAPEATETPTETEKIVEVATETPTETEKIVEVATEAPAASVDKAAVETVVEELQAKVGKENVVVSKRLEEQQKYLNLPILSTTTIGSFPQTPELRRVRRKVKCPKCLELKLPESTHLFIRKNALRNLGVHTSLSTLCRVERRRVSHMVFRIHMLQPWLKAGCIASRRAKVEVRNCPPLIGQDQ
jgi:hypothetical protein